MPTAGTGILGNDRRDEFDEHGSAAVPAGGCPETVERCLREINSRDYPADVIDEMCAHFTDERFIELSTHRLVYVAVAGGQVIGTVSRDGNKVYTLFVDPDLAGRGVGRQLMEHIEALAAVDGYDHVETAASITAHRSCRGLGYRDIRKTGTEFGVNYIVRKPWSRPDRSDRCGISAIGRQPHTVGSRCCQTADCGYQTPHDRL